MAMSTEHVVTAASAFAVFVAQLINNLRTRRAVMRSLNDWDVKSILSSIHRRIGRIEQHLQFTPTPFPSELGPEDPTKPGQGSS